MFDNQLISLIINTIIAQEAELGINGLPIYQAFQPTQQGVDKETSLYLYKIRDEKYGFATIANFWDEQQNKMIHTEEQRYQTTFQFSCLSIQNPENVNQKTASDILNLIVYILQNNKTIDIFKNNGIGILRINDIKNTYFLDDFNRYEAIPSFEFSVMHKQTIISNTNKIEFNEINIISI